MWSCEVWARHVLLSAYPKLWIVWPFFHTHTFNLWSGSIFFSQFEYVPFGLSPTESYDHLFHRGILDSCDWLLVDYGILLGYAILIILQCNDVHVFSTAYVSWTKLREESYSVMEYRESTTLEIATKIMYYCYHPGLITIVRLLG
jgi:hypothetical protein